MKNAWPFFFVNFLYLHFSVSDTYVSTDVIMNVSVNIFTEPLDFVALDISRKCYFHS